MHNNVLEDICTSGGVSESESAARANAWMAEAATEREKGHYVPITASWAVSALQKYSDPRVQKLDRAAQRVQDRLAFDAQAHLDPLPPQGIQYIEEARHLRRVRYAAGGDTLAARFAVCDARLCQAAARGEEWAVHIVDGRTPNQSPWGDISAADLHGWGVANGDTADLHGWVAANDTPDVGPEPGIDGGAVEDSAGDVIEDDGGFMITRTVSPEPWWVTHPGHSLEEVDDAPSPPTYARTSL